jgi:SAM-dependent methyltransferase
VQKTTLENSSFQASFFDVITSFDVIEHIPDPNALLRKAHEILRPGGVIYLQTPNLAGLNARLLGTRWESLEPDDHVCLYTPISLKRILSRHGFDTVKIMTLDLNLVEFRHIFQPARGETNRKQRQQERRQFIGQVMRSRWLRWGRTIANGGLSILGWGDKLVVEAQKRG